MAEFITISDIKNESSVSAQVDPKFIEPYIKTASDMHIENILGTSFSDELKELIDIYSGVTGITGSNYTLLVRYIKPAHIWSCVFEALHFLDKKIKNGGIVRSAGNDSTNLTTEDFQDFEQKIKDNTFFYKNKLINYLNDNANLFPSYRCSASTNNINSIGIYLGPN